MWVHHERGLKTVWIRILNHVLHYPESQLVLVSPTEKKENISFESGVQFFECHAKKRGERNNIRSSWLRKYFKVYSVLNISGLMHFCASVEVFGTFQDWPLTIGMHQKLQMTGSSKRDLMPFRSWGMRWFLPRINQCIPDLFPEYIK